MFALALLLILFSDVPPFSQNTSFYPEQDRGLMLVFIRGRCRFSGDYLYSHPKRKIHDYVRYRTLNNTLLGLFVSFIFNTFFIGTFYSQIVLGTWILLLLMCQCNLFPRVSRYVIFIRKHFLMSRAYVLQFMHASEAFYLCITVW